MRLTVTRLATVVACLLLAPAPAADAQQRDKVARVGVLRARETLTPDRIEALQKGLSEFGYVGVIEERYADGRLERLPELAAELVTLQVDVILATDGPAAHAAKKAIRTIPIVFVGPADPVGSGLVPNLARPGGNITGVSSATDVSFAGKWLELVKEMLPRATRIGFIWSPTNAAGVARFRGLERAAPTLGLKLQSLEARTPAGQFPLALSLHPPERRERYSWACAQIVPIAGAFGPIPAHSGAR